MKMISYLVRNRVDLSLLRIFWQEEQCQKLKNKNKKPQTNQKRTPM